MIDPRELLKRLLDYIGEQAIDINPKAYRLTQWPHFKCFPKDITGLPGVESDIKVEGDHVWLRIQRLVADKPPAVTSEFSRIIVVSTNPNGPVPHLDETAFQARVSETVSDMDIEERAALEEDLRAKINAYIEEYTGIWGAWAEGEKPRRKTISLYGDFFALKHKLEAEETAKPEELVWGTGMAYWRLSTEGESLAYDYPILTQTVEITLDEKTMALEIRPRATETRVEMDAFIALRVLGAADVEKTAREHLTRNNDHPVTPFDPSSYTDVLKLVAGNLDKEGQYVEVDQDMPSSVPTSSLTVTNSWVLFSRPRSNNYLLEDLKRLKERLETGCRIPEGPLSLVSPPSDQPIELNPISFRGLSGRGAIGPGGSRPQDLYFPMPYNDEQVAIVQRLERAPGVAVQGPPGTGKTHTIANIICHYLATGRRVLVTSRGESALKVLQAKIPKSVRPLTVSLLASDRDGVRQFQASIESIQHQVSQIIPEQTRREIDTRQAAIDRVHAELSRIDQRMDAIAMAQLSEIVIDGVPMRAEKLARLVVDGEQIYGWFDDAVGLSEEYAPPLDTEEAGRLREARRILGKDLLYLGANIPSADDLPPIVSIGNLHEVLSKMRLIEREVENGTLLPLRALTPDVLSAARALLAQIDEAKAILVELEAHESGWPLELRVKCRLPSFSSERQALESLFADIEALVKARTEFLQRPVEMPESGLSSENVRKAIARGAATGKPFSPLALGKRGTKTLVAAIKVSGRAPANADDWKHITRYLELHEQIASFLVRWNNFSDTLSMPRLEGGVNALRQIEIVALTATKAHRLATDFDVNLTKFAEAVFDHVPAKELMGSTADLEKVRQQLSQHLMRAELAKAVLDLAILQEKLAGKTGPISEELRVFVEEKLGKPEISVEQIVSLYSQITAELRRLAGLAVPLGWVSEACSRIEVAGAPRFAARLRSVAVASAGEDSAFPPNWRDAWNWARMRSHLDNIEAREELRALAQQRRELELGLARLYQELVAKAAWLATKRNATPKVLQALAGYATAIRRIGQGTGPNAMRYRRDARDAMKDAAGAVPCWIMSHARISEAMPPDIGAFDLVIVDEASQSDLWAMPAILRGKKILVVGDDKQVSPDSGFISSQRIGELKDRFLSDQPYGVEMTPEKSLYDLSARVFAAHQIMLREHFRCVPPIIAYSNRQFYERGIRPLRIPTTSERLDPPLIDIYVPDGHRDNRDCNRMEAEVIAEEIVAICANPQFAGRSIGVVSLLGMDQAKLIDETVLRRVDAAELMRRDFLSGDARTFQGSERDIMFLSMVVSPDACKALSGNIFDQRFNVAASRARDRMYLVRSVAASHLSSKDLRLSLLSHFDKPIVVDENEAENLRGRCESEFERAVFDALNERGYRVIPQVKTGAYRIDMVVEGTGDARLAIECDGDPFHGPDRWPQDMQRQRVLERAGWTFWRCFASTWTLHREEVLRELLEKLMAMGIEPVGAVTVMPSLVEKRVWKYATENEKIDSAINDVSSKALETNASINTMVSIQSSCAS